MKEIENAYSLSSVRNLSSFYFYMDYTFQLHYILYLNNSFISYG